MVGVASAQVGNGAKGIIDGRNVEWLVRQAGLDEAVTAPEE